MLDDDQECALGVLDLPLCQMLPCADLTLEQRFQLDHSGLDSLISMRLVLRVTVPSAPRGGRGGLAGEKPGMESQFLSLLRILSVVIS